MTEHPTLPPGWTEAAVEAGAALGLGTGFATMSAEEWGLICGHLARTMAARGAAPPPGWEDALARQVGRPEGGRPDASRADPDELARDEADTVLAEKGEVFAPEDDA